MTNGKFCLLFLRLCSAAPIFAPSPMRSFAAGWGSRPQQVRRLNGQLLRLSFQSRRLSFQSRRLDFQSQEVWRRGPRTPIYYTYFIPSKNVSTLQPLSILRWESAQNWLKGLNFKPFSRVQRGGVERLFVACAPPGLGMDHPPCHSRLKGLKGLKNKPFSHFFYENKWRNDGG